MENSQLQESEQNKLLDLFKRTWDNKIFRILFGGLIGAGAGWMYWEFIGCNGGSCPITSNEPQTIVIFSLFGMWYNFKK